MPQDVLLQGMLLVVANAESMLEVAVGDHLLLPQGNRDVLCKVRKVESDLFFLFRAGPWPNQERSIWNDTLTSCLAIHVPPPSPPFVRLGAS